jgi:hypothetical protein
MDEGKKSIWSQSLLVRLATYSAGSSILVTGFEAFILWKIPRMGIASTEMKLRDLEGTAFVMFWYVFLFAGAILGTLHFFIRLKKYLHIASKGDKEVQPPA